MEDSANQFAIRTRPTLMENVSATMARRSSMENASASTSAHYTATMITRVDAVFATVDTQSSMGSAAAINIVD